MNANNWVETTVHEATADLNMALGDIEAENREAMIDCDSGESLEVETEEEREEREDYERRLDAFEDAQRAGESAYLEYLRACAAEEQYEQDYGE